MTCLLGRTDVLEMLTALLIEARGNLSASCLLTALKIEASKTSETSVNI
jgi:hypothetical protein